MSGGVIIYGDPHGKSRLLLRACEEERPDGVVIPGDCDLALPLGQQIKAVLDAGILVRWIPGNHDADNTEWRDRHTGASGTISAICPNGDRWRGGLPLRVRDAIFPADVEALRGCRVDVLMTHEAPTCHRHGFVGIDMAAEACRARLVVHGHHHQSYAGGIGRETN